VTGQMDALEEEVIESRKLIDAGVRLWETRPYQFISWWDMKPFPVVRLLVLIRAFQEGVTSQKSVAEEAIKPEVRDSMIDHVKEWRSEFNECFLSSAVAQCNRIIDQLGLGCTDAEAMRLFDELMNRVEDQCREHAVMVIDPEYVKYAIDNFDPTDTSAQKVSVQFTSAADDIAEAGKCLSCGRSTACVMHLNRVVEVGLTALATALNISSQKMTGGSTSKRLTMNWPIDSRLRVRGQEMSNSMQRLRSQSIRSVGHGETPQCMLLKLTRSNSPRKFMLQFGHSCVI
jgi:hypothetical protein